MRLPENDSLKDKRQVLRSVIARVKRQFGVAIAEVDAQDQWRTAVLGVSCVSNSSAHARDILNTVVNFIEGTRLDAEVTEVEIEVLAI